MRCSKKENTVIPYLQSSLMMANRLIHDDDVVLGQMHLLLIIFVQYNSALYLKKIVIQFKSFKKH